MMIRIALQGIRGSYCEQAAVTLAKRQGWGERVEPLFAVSAEGVRQALVEGRADFGVLALANSTAGPVAETERVLKRPAFKVIAAIDWAVHHCLFVRDGSVPLAAVRRVASHEQALRQCRKNLRKLLPGAEPIAAPDTALAALRLAAGSYRRDTAVICSARAGAIYRLHQVQARMEDAPDNTTRFGLLGPAGNQTRDRGRAAPQPANSAMEWKNIDWSAPERLRQDYLDGTAGRADYWQSETDLASYDLTFGQRIGWKWQALLAGLDGLGWRPPAGPVVDWGCGSGIAGRAVADHFGAAAIEGLLYRDRSALAERFAVRRAGEELAGIAAQGFKSLPADGFTLVVSHLLTELPQHEVEALVAVARKASAVLVVEPGSRPAAAALVSLREALRRDFSVVAPCTHGNRCPMLDPDNACHWCHHFAAPPAAVFTDGNWARFAGRLQIDLHQLPFSALVLDRRPRPPLPEGAVRIVGRPRLSKGYALLLACGGKGLAELRLFKKRLPQEYRLLKKGGFPMLQRFRVKNNDIEAVEPVDG